MPRHAWTSETARAARAKANCHGAGRKPDEVKALARQYTDEAVQALVEVMREPDPRHGRNRVAAAQVLLERGWGKPLTSVEISGPEGEAIPFAYVSIPIPALTEETP